MPEIKSLSFPTVTGENVPRHKMLQWVNTTLSSKYTKIEELCSGVAYCQLMERIFPNCIGMRRVKTQAKLEHDFIYNLKLFQAAFLKMNFDKNVPIDKLVKGRFQDNFEFLQWFKKFYDMHSNDNKENSKATTNTLAVGKPIRKAISATNLKADSSPIGGIGGGSAKKTTPTSAPGASSMRAKSSSTSHLTPRSSQPSRPISPSSVEVLTETCTQLKEQIGIAENDKNYYFNKLQLIENLCIECDSKNEYPDWTKKILGILYEKEVDDAASANY
ncbi:microtubule-associated protein RP/EB family member 2-like [Episyrphus balteatus]|uniref:microtubule-associated protein RP/EB family member 2-like n=1 Tax=Episyrphus balteatus TaxID=286459 RepID=UPI00248605FF|nr:microtubule-associated protein RP/EB family member 2-like [Episyrphus balteatus]